MIGKYIVIFILLMMPLFAKNVNFLANLEVMHFIDKMVSDYGFSDKKLRELFTNAKFQEKTLKIYNTPFKAYINDASWVRYKKHIITDKKIQRAKKFMKKHKDTLQKAEDKYRVPKEYITAFIGIESNFGSHMGKSDIFDSLATLAFYENRKMNFFRSELEYFLLITRNKGIDPSDQTGSFAGAMGFVQQLPSVHHMYGVDFDGDGEKNLFSMADCIGTIAYFMYANGWENGREVVIKASYDAKRYNGLKTGYNQIYTIEKLMKNGIKPIKFFPESKASLLQIRDANHDELWLGANNFQVLTSYNNSTNYALALHKIAQRLKK